uniref:Uncharacterized protein n=1 Tax=viral metagenome TaxID=1070528 RepID=A0A6H2A365_9ZZZZ
MSTSDGLPTGSERETVLNMLEAVGEYDPARYRGTTRASILESLVTMKGAVKILARRLRAALSVKRELVRCPRVGGNRGGRWNYGHGELA